MENRNGIGREYREEKEKNTWKGRGEGSLERGLGPSSLPPSFHHQLSFISGLGPSTGCTLVQVQVPGLFSSISTSTVTLLCTEVQVQVHFIVLKYKYFM